MTLILLHTFSDWSNDTEEKGAIKITEPITSMHGSYDGGRFCFTVNDTEVFSTLCCSHDVSLAVEITS